MKLAKYGVIFSVCALFLNCTNVKQDMMVIGHRGAKGHVAENTLESIEKALELGADGVEIDVFRCDSGEIVLMHDETVDRTTNGSGYIEDLSVFQINSLTVEGKYKIPILQDVLKLLQGKAKLNIELKGKKTADKVSHIVNYYIENRGWHAGDILVSSFNWDELRSFRERNDKVPIGVLTEEDPLKALAVAKELNAYAIHPDFKTLTAENVEEIQDAGFKIFTWTVNEPEDIQRIKELGVDAIISDYPERVK